MARNEQDARNVNGDVKCHTKGILVNKAPRKRPVGDVSQANPGGNLSTNEIGPKTALSTRDWVCQQTLRGSLGEESGSISYWSPSAAGTSIGQDPQHPPSGTGGPGYTWPRKHWRGLGVVLSGRGEERLSSA